MLQFNCVQCSCHPMLHERWAQWKRRETRLQYDANPSTSFTTTLSYKYVIPSILIQEFSKNSSLNCHESSMSTKFNNLWIMVSKILLIIELHPKNLTNMSLFNQFFKWLSCLYLINSFIVLYPCWINYLLVSWSFIVLYPCSINFLLVSYYFTQSIMCNRLIFSCGILWN